MIICASYIVSDLSCFFLVFKADDDATIAKHDVYPLFRPTSGKARQYKPAHLTGDGRRGLRALISTLLKESNPISFALFCASEYEQEVLN